MPNYFTILFDVVNDGVLTSPESGSQIEVALFYNAGWHTGKVWSYDDMVWSDYVSSLRRPAWIFAEDYYWPNPQPAFTRRNIAVEYDNSTGTLIILFSRYLWRPSTSEFNAFQMRRGERWVMGFLLELGYATWYGEYQDFVDGWPRKAYPYLDNDASWWPKLVIDLANPPPSLTT